MVGPKVLLDENELVPPPPPLPPYELERDEGPLPMLPLLPVLRGTNEGGKVEEGGAEERNSAWYVPMGDSMAARKGELVECARGGAEGGRVSRSRSA